MTVCVADATMSSSEAVLRLRFFRRFFLGCGAAGFTEGCSSSEVGSSSEDRRLREDVAAAVLVVPWSMRACPFCDSAEGSFTQSLSFFCCTCGGWYGWCCGTVLPGVLVLVLEQLVVGPSAPPWPPSLPHSLLGAVGRFQFFCLCFFAILLAPEQRDEHFLLSSSSTKIALTIWWSATSSSVSKGFCLDVRCWVVASPVLDYCCMVVGWPGKLDPSVPLLIRMMYVM